jgi:hypothetical protein
MEPSDAMRCDACGVVWCGVEKMKRIIPLVKVRMECSILKSSKRAGGTHPPSELAGGFLKKSPVLPTCCVAVVVMLVLFCLSSIFVQE